MKILVLLSLISSTFFPVFAEGHKKYKDEDFDKIKLMKIEYLNKKIDLRLKFILQRELKLEHLLLQLLRTKLLRYRFLHYPLYVLVS